MKDKVNDNLLFVEKSLFVKENWMSVIKVIWLTILKIFSLLVTLLLFVITLITELYICRLSEH